MRTAGRPGWSTTPAARAIGWCQLTDGAGTRIPPPRQCQAPLCRKGSILSNPQEPYQPGHRPTAAAAAHPGSCRHPQAPHPQSRGPGLPGPTRAPAAALRRSPGVGSHRSGLPGPAPGQEPQELWIILGIAGGVLLLVVLGIIILVNVVGGATNQARGLADGFTKLVIAGDNPAYDDYLDPALQEQLSKEDFIAGVESLEMDETCKPATTTSRSARKRQQVGRHRRRHHLRRQGGGPRLPLRRHRRAEDDQHQTPARRPSSAGRNGRASVPGTDVPVRRLFAAVSCSGGAG